MTPAQFIDDPEWAAFLPERTDSPRARHLPTQEDCSSLDSEKTVAHLRRGGTLGDMPGYEERQGQLDMCGAIVRAFNAREHLMIEAGTGVGKSLAYLVPSILWARLNDTAVIVSTATRNLQSQLITSDIPRALRVLGEESANFKVALLKGRSNYLCLRAVGEFFAAGYWTMSEDEQAEMPHFIEWLRTTQDGDLDRYEGLPRNLLSCPGDECAGRRCPYYTRCFVFKARKSAFESHLIVANHSLVMAEALSPGGGLLPPYGRVVIDEAHKLEDVATDALSKEFSLPELTHIMNRLMRKGRGKHARSGGALAAVERQCQRGVIAGGATSAIGRLVGEVPMCLVRVFNAAEEIADIAESRLKVNKRNDVLRFKARDWDGVAIFDAQTRFDNEMSDLVKKLHALRDALAEMVPEGEVNPCGDIVVQLTGIAQSLVNFANDTNFVLKGDKDTHAYWIERMRPIRRPAYVRVMAAPLSVAGELNELIWKVKDSAILSSATLRVGNDFKYRAARLGCAERFQCLTAASPFDYLKQAMVLAVDYLTDPSESGDRFAEELSMLLVRLCDKIRGRTLVLFTSYEMMNLVAERAREGLARVGISLFVQGEGLSREAMTERLRGDGETVLFGAQSFWEGVDVAGDALSCVVLARLPFAQRTDPIVEARSEQIDRDGGSAFRDYYLPEAVIRFRQGFGRLVRSKRDRGVVVVADPRIAVKGYGAIFRRSIPSSVHTVSSEDELMGRVEEFFE